jgi:hypothetical protein
MGLGLGLGGRDTAGDSTEGVILVGQEAKPNRSCSPVLTLHT